MLGDGVLDPRQLESDVVTARGLALLELQTELGVTKRLVRTAGRVHTGLPGVWSALGGVAVEGYEIHVGRSSGSVQAPLLELNGSPDGSVSADGLAAGTYLHGMFEHPEARYALVRALARTRGFDWSPVPLTTHDPYDELARTLAESVSLRTTRVNCLIAT